MDSEGFWTLIGDCKRQGLSGGKRDAWLGNALLGLPPGDVVAFQACLDRVIAETFSWNLWAAADRLFGGWCSDDTFCYFQRWMVGLGRPVFEAAVHDPDALAYVPGVQRLAGRPRETWGEDAPQWPTLPDLAPAAHAELTGAPEDDFHAAVAALRSTALPPVVPRGRRWSVLDAAESRTRLPRLSAMFPLAEAS
jgi:hypothetical protein